MRLCGRQNNLLARAALLHFVAVKSVGFLEAANTDKRKLAKRYAINIQET